MRFKDFYYLDEMVVPDWIKQSSDAELDNYERLHPGLEDKTKQEIAFEKINRKRPKDTKLVTYEIKKIGRKWIEGVVPGRSFVNKIQINDTTKDFQVGKTYSFNASVKVDTNKYGTSVEVYPISDVQLSSKIDYEQKQKETFNQKEIEKWLGWIEEKVKEGYLYKNGVEKVNSLGIAKYPALQTRLDAARKVITDSEKKYQEQLDAKKAEEAKKQKIYLNVPYEEKDFVKSHGAKWDSNWKQWYVLDKIPSELQKYHPDSIRQKEKDDGILRLSGGSGYGYVGWHVGQVVQATAEQKKQGYPEFLYVTDASKKYFSDDGMSFGVGDEQGHIYYAKVRAATEEESKSLKEKLQKQEDKKIAIQKIESLKKKIEDEGERPKETQNLSGERILDTQNIYGGGDWFEITNDAIWYIRNNGMDGDNWSNNNIRTGGAGGIGWKIPKTEEKVKELKSLASIVKE